MTKQLVEQRNDQIVTTSIQVAKDFGKTHKTILRKIENMLNSSVAQKCSTEFSKYFAKGTYKNKQNHSYPIYYMNKTGFSLLANGLTGSKALEFRLKYIHAFDAMENKLRQQVLPQTPEQKLSLTMEVTKRTVARVDSVEKDVKQLKDNVLIDTSSYGAIGRRVTQRVYDFLKSSGYPAYGNNVSLMYKDINHGVKVIAGVQSRSRIKDKDFDKVMDFINSWEPSTATKMQLTKDKKAS